MIGMYNVHDWAFKPVESLDEIHLSSPYFSLHVNTCTCDFPIDLKIIVLNTFCCGCVYHMSACIHVHVQCVQCMELYIYTLDG